jgi:hypothetical protein
LEEKNRGLKRDTKKGLSAKIIKDMDREKRQKGLVN